MGTSGSGKSGQGNGYEAVRWNTNIWHALKVQRKYVAFARRDAVGQRAVQVLGVIGRQIDGRVANNIPRHGLLSGRRLNRPLWLKSASAWIVVNISNRSDFIAFVPFPTVSCLSIKIHQRWTCFEINRLSNQMQSHKVRKSIVEWSKKRPEAIRHEYFKILMHKS